MAIGLTDFANTNRASTNRRCKTICSPHCHACSLRRFACLDAGRHRLAFDCSACADVFAIAWRCAFDFAFEYFSRLAHYTVAGLVMTPALNSLHLIVEPVDMRLGIEGLSAKVHATLQRSPCDGAAYAFRNQRSNRLKVLLWDATGVWLLQRRLHQGRFVWPRGNEAAFVLDAAQWQWLTMGVEWQRLSPPMLGTRLY